MSIKFRYSLSHFLQLRLELGAAQLQGSKLKPATGKAYKALRAIINKQCHDQELVYCGMKKVRAKDGLIEFVGTDSAAQFVEEGASCLIWNKMGTNSAALSA